MWVYIVTAKNALNKAAQLDLYYMGKDCFSLDLQKAHRYVGATWAEKVAERASIRELLEAGAIRDISVQLRKVK